MAITPQGISHLCDTGLEEVSNLGVLCVSEFQVRVVPCPTLRLCGFPFYFSSLSGVGKISKEGTVPVKQLPSV